MYYHINGRQASIDITNELKRKLVAVVRNGEFRKDVGHLYADMIEPFVPKRTGKLRNYVTVSDKYITYHAQYAKKVYEVPFAHYTTPNTSDHWDLHANPVIWEDFIAEVNQLWQEYAEEM